MAFNWGPVGEGIARGGDVIAGLFAKKYDLEEDERREKERFEREKSWQTAEADKDRKFRMEMIAKQADLDKSFFDYKTDYENNAKLFLGSKGLQEMAQSQDPTMQAFAAKLTRKFGSYEELDKDDWDFVLNNPNVAPDARMAIMAMNLKTKDFNTELKYRTRQLNMYENLYASRSNYYDKRSETLASGDPIKIAKEFRLMDKENQSLLEEANRIRTNTEFAFADAQFQKGGKVVSDVLRGKYESWTKRLGEIEDQIEENKITRAMFSSPQPGGQGQPGEGSNLGLLKSFFDAAAQKSGKTVEEVQAEFAKLPEAEQQQRLQYWLSLRGGQMPSPGGAK